MQRIASEPRLAATSRTHSGTLWRHMAQQWTGAIRGLIARARSGLFVRSFAQIHDGLNDRLMPQLHGRTKNLTSLHARIGTTKGCLAQIVYWVNFFRAEVETAYRLAGPGTRLPDSMSERVARLRRYIRGDDCVDEPEMWPSHRTSNRALALSSMAMRESADFTCALGAAEKSPGRRPGLRGGRQFKPYGVVDETL
jgi:hypothetical protein